MTVARLPGGAWLRAGSDAEFCAGAIGSVPVPGRYGSRDAGRLCALIGDRHVAGNAGEGLGIARGDDPVPLPTANGRPDLLFSPYGYVRTLTAAFASAS